MLFFRRRPEIFGAAHFLLEMDQESILQKKDGLHWNAILVAEVDATNLRLTLSEPANRLFSYYDAGRKQ